MSGGFGAFDILKMRPTSTGGEARGPAGVQALGNKDADDGAFGPQAASLDVDPASTRDLLAAPLLRLPDQRFAQQARACLLTELGDHREIGAVGLESCWQGGVLYP